MKKGDFVWVRWGTRTENPARQLAVVFNLRVKDGVKQVQLSKWLDNSRRWTKWYIATDVLDGVRTAELRGKDDALFRRAVVAL